jgi:hypothetical protein
MPEHLWTALMVGLFIIAGGIVLNFFVSAVRLWRTLGGDPERRNVQMLSGGATKEDLSSIFERLKEAESDLADIRRELKTDREALAKSMGEQTRYLNDQVTDVLEAVSELRGTVNEMRRRPVRPNS